jgi:hypothetical protein
MDDALKLQADVSALATAEGRKVGTPGHDVAKSYLLERLDSINLQPYQGDSMELSYTSGGYTFSNLVAVIPGKNRSLKPILVGAHYDSVISSFCADDNAAAVAIALSAAEKLTNTTLSRDVVIAIFDAEEMPYSHGPDMGSTRFYIEQRRPEGFHVALIMDLVGHDVELPFPGMDALGGTLTDLLFMTGAESHSALPHAVRSCLPGPELPVIASLNRNVGDMSDHHIFRLSGIPFLFLSCGRWQHYHQVTDTPDRLNYLKMAKICNLVVNLCQTIAACGLSRDDCLATPESLENGVMDTTSFEIELIKTAFGDSLKSFMAAIQLTSLDSRQDLDELASRLQGFFRL